MRASNHVQLKERKQLTFDNFKGVDFSSSPLNAKFYHAVQMQNFINEGGANKKRNGWKEVYKGNDEIKAIFDNGKDDNGNALILVQQGKNLNKLKYNEMGILVNDGVQSTGLLTDNKAQIFSNGGKTYIVGGGAFIASEPYVPTTTININDITVEADVRAVLEMPNLLTTRRINKLVGRAFNGETSLTFKLDANADSVYSVVVETASKKQMLTNEDENNPQYSVSENKLTIYVDTTPPVEGRDNITVEFDAVITNQRTKIDKCKFGILFGINGAVDRLFLSGNPDCKNTVFFSEPNNFDYFPDDNNFTIGSDNSAVVAFSRLSDRTLAIFKDENADDANMFYVTGENVTEYDENGNPELVARFRSSACSFGETVIARDACANLGGDSLILSNNGVFGVVLAENAVTTERYARNRSANIDAKLTKEPHLKDATAIVYKGRYYLAVPDDKNNGVVYIADQRYKFTNPNDVDNSFNYEWWYWTNVPVTCWAVIDDKLYFGTADGRIGVFDDEYTDRTFTEIEQGYLSFDTERNGLICSKDLIDKISVNDKIEYRDNGKTVGVYVQSVIKNDDGNGGLIRIKEHKNGTNPITPPTHLTGLLWHETDIKAEWYTPVLDLGTNESAKTLLKMTMCTNPETNGQLSFGYETKNAKSIINAKGLNIFSFDNIDFNNFSFDTGFANSYSVKCNERDFNFIQFKFYSDNDYNCSINNFTIIYKINKANRGVA